MRFVNYKDRKRVATALKPIYTAVNDAAAKDALEEFAASELGLKYPTTVRTFEAAWDRFTPFLAFPPMVRRVIYTTNSIVISSPLGAVVDVDHAPVRLRWVRGGGGYLLPVHHGLRRRFDVGAAGGPGGVTGRVLDGARGGRPAGRGDRAVLGLPDCDRAVAEHGQGLCA